MELFDNSIWIDRFDDISIVVYVIGYPKEGESIVLSLQNEHEPIFTIVTDCYEENENNYTIGLLRDIGVGQIDAFVWTHPDRDHSLGIINLLTEFDKNRESTIFIPSTFNGGQWYHVCKEAHNAINFLMENYNSNNKYQLGFVSLVSGEPPRVLLKKRIIEKTSGNRIDLRIKFIAPNGALAERRDGTRNDFTLNDLSIVYLFSVNNCHYLFTGDLVDQTIRFIKEQINTEDDNYLFNLRFIKIPHHGSSSSEKLIDLLESMLLGSEMCVDQKSIISVSTVFEKDNLPECAILNRYQNISSRVYCTGNNKGASCGCVKINYNLNGMLKKDPELLGNAYLFKE